LEPQSVQYY